MKQRTGNSGWTGRVAIAEEADLPRTDDFYVKQIVGGGIFVERPGEMQTLTMTSEAIGPYCRLQVTHERLDGWTMTFDLTTSDNGGVSGRVQVEGVNCTGEGTVIGTRSPRLNDRDRGLSPWHFPLRR